MFKTIPSYKGTAFRPFLQLLFFSIVKQHVLDINIHT